MRARVTAMPASAFAVSSTRALPRATATTSSIVTPWSSRPDDGLGHGCSIGIVVRVGRRTVSGRRRRRGRRCARAGHPDGRPGAGGSARRAPRGRRARRRRGARRRSRRSAAPRRPSPTTRASDGVIRMSRTATAMQNGIDRRVATTPGCSRPRARRSRPRRAAGARRGTAARVENSAPGSSVATVPLPASASTSASSRWVQWSAEAAPTSTASCTPGPCCELVGVDARLRGRAPCPAREDLARLVAVEGAAVAEHVDPARVRRARVEHLARSRARRSRRRGRRTPAGTTCAPRNVTSSTYRRGDPQRARLVVARVRP